MTDETYNDTVRRYEILVIFEKGTHVSNLLTKAPSTPFSAKLSYLVILVTPQYLQKIRRFTYDQRSSAHGPYAPITRPT